MEAEVCNNSNNPGNKSFSFIGYLFNQDNNPIIASPWSGPLLFK